jgi:hypothetical protein
VKVFNVFDVEIAQSDSFNVTLRADDDVLHLVTLSMTGDTLNLRLRQGLMISSGMTLEARVTMPDLEGLYPSGTASATVSESRSEDKIDIALLGASNLDGHLQADSIDLDASGASTVTLMGSAGDFAIVRSGASDLDLADSAVDTAEVRLSGASEATVNVRELIDPLDSGAASRLRYLGDPSSGNVSTSGATRVEQIGD